MSERLDSEGLRSLGRNIIPAVYPYSTLKYYKGRKIEAFGGLWRGGAGGQGGWGIYILIQIQFGKNLSVNQIAPQL